MSSFSSSGGHPIWEYNRYNSDYICTSKHEKRHKHTSSNKPDSKSEFLDWADIVATALVVVILMFTFVFRVATIEGESMTNTFMDGEKVVISNLRYTPHYGDVVVISRNYLNQRDKTDHDSQPIIKRVIATEGQTVSIDFENGIVYVDGNPLTENYTRTPTNNKFDLDFPLEGDVVTVPKGCVFVMGDNRNNSLDSRCSAIGNLGNGMVNTEYILGKVYLRIYPFQKFGGIN